jgi:hypothetical protein
MGNPDCWVERRSDGAAKAGGGQVQRGNTLEGVVCKIGHEAASLLSTSAPAP